MVPNKPREANDRRGSKQSGVNDNGPAMNVNNNVNIGTGVGMPNLTQNMGGTFMQGMIGAMGGNIPFTNLQLQSQGGRQIAIGGMSTNQQMQGLIAMNNSNMANINMGTTLNQLNQNQGQNDQQLRLMNFLAQQQQQQQQRQAGMGCNQQQHVQAPQVQMQTQSFMPNQTPMQSPQTLIPNQPQLLHNQQQQLLQMNLHKRQNELQLQATSQANSSPPAHSWNMNTTAPVMGVNIPATSPVHHLQMAAAQAQAQNMFQDQLQQWQAQGGNQRKQSSVPSSTQNIEYQRPGSGVSVMQQHQQRPPSSASQHRSGSSVSTGQKQRRSSSNISVDEMQHNMQTNQTMQVPLISNHLFSQSSSLENKQQLNLHLQLSSPAEQSNHSQPPSNIGTSVGQFTQSRPASNIAIDTRNQRDNQTQTTTNLQNSSEESRKMPNQFFRQQNNIQNATQALSNISGGQSRNPRQPMQRRPSNHDAVSMPMQSTQIESNHNTNSGHESRPVQHLDQQVQAQAWFLFQQVRGLFFRIVCMLTAQLMLTSC